MTTYRVTPISTHITRDDGGSIRVELEELEILLIEGRKLMAAVEPVKP